MIILILNNFFSGEDNSSFLFLLREVRFGYIYALIVIKIVPILFHPRLVTTDYSVDFLLVSFWHNSILVTLPCLKFVHGFDPNHNILYICVLFMLQNQ